MALRAALTFNPDRAAIYLEQGLWNNDTLSGWLTKYAAETPDTSAIITSTERVSYEQLKNKVDCLTCGLMGLGLGKGDIVAVQLPNIQEFLIAYLAIGSFGGVMQTIHMPYAQADIEFLLEHAKARAVICLPAFKKIPTVQIMLECKQKFAALEHVVVLGPETVTGAIEFSSLMAENTPVIGNPPVGADPYLLLYTSGTTSNPKAVPLTYQNMMSNSRLSVDKFQVTNDDRILSVAPFSHLYGLHNYHIALCAGAAAVLLPAFAPTEMAQLVETARPTAIFLGPAHAVALQNAGILDNHDFSSVRFSVFSGAYCPPDLLRTYHSSTGSIVCQLWGMTELAAGTYSYPHQNMEVGINSAGPAAPGNEIRVVDQEIGEAVSADTEGELQVRGCSVFPGYLDNPQANADAFADDGWFRTGDLAMINQDGNLKITGRIKDAINRGGVKYNPAEIEEILLTDSKIEMVAIAPVADASLGERACCFVQMKPGESTDLDDICSLLERKNISKNKWPERLIIVDEMPLTPTRKVIKSRLTEQVQKTT
ncbi:MAG TPA: hypothetical protein EYN43_07030 [Gammaproteobacteria bacterium]|jgi:non-ribosomal peptide synthetase component E (peptide arylation enzyme)|nr:hypothetical protein [Gammaproteobacteria bacterium]